MDIVHNVGTYCVTNAGGYFPCIARDVVPAKVKNGVLSFATLALCLGQALPEVATFVAFHLKGLPCTCTLPALALGLDYGVLHAGFDMVRMF